VILLAVVISENFDTNCADLHELVRIEFGMINDGREPRLTRAGFFVFLET
jgi:hypothetical protein